MEAGAFAAKRRAKGETRLWDLYLGELNPLVTNRANFWLVWAVTAVVSLVALPFFYGFMEGYMVFAYAILPSFTTVFAATTYTRDRASGFASVVQTVPVSNTEYFLSKFLASMTLGVVFLAVTLPFTGLALFFMGGGALWDSFGKYLLFSVPLMVVSTSLGLFASIIIGKRGLLASAMTGFGTVVLFSGVGIFLRVMQEEFRFNEAAQRDAEGSTIIAIFKQISNLSHVSPVVNALEWADNYGENMGLAWKNLITVVWVAVAMSVGAWFIYSKLQNVEGWDCPKWASIGSVLAVLAVASAPVAVFDYFEDQAIPGFDPNQQPEMPPFYLETRFIPVGAQYDPNAPYYWSSDQNDYMLRVGETRAVQAVLIFQSNSGGAATYNDVLVRFKSGGNAELRFDPPAILVKRVSFNPDAGRSSFVVTHPMNVTASSSTSLGEAYTYMQPEVDYAGKTYMFGSGMGYTVYQPSYRWYYPFYVLAALTAVEAAPFVWRSLKVGKRGM